MAPVKDVEDFLVAVDTLLPENRELMQIELSVYGVSAAEFVPKTPADGGGAPAQVPPTPRVLHKLTLLLNPRQMIHPDAERCTGLNNYLLEFEKPFDDNAANTLLGFLRHLPAPVCLVAHNGWSFDFPIVKNALEKLHMELPNGITCLDSLQAFMEIDHNRKIATTAPTTPSAPEITETVSAQPPTITTTTEGTIQQPTTVIGEVLNMTLLENIQANWRAHNETTPKRRPTSITAANRKRKLLAEADAKVSPASPEKMSTPTSTLRSRRALFATPSGSNKSLRGHIFRKYPPKGVYRLGPMYRRIFGQIPKIAHHAEADVEMLMSLMLHYGEDFAAYAAERALPFAEVHALGK